MNKTPKTADSWRNRGYIFHERGKCPACNAAVEFWWAPGRRVKKTLVPIDAATFEAHFAACPNAQELRAIMLEVQA